MSQTVMKGAKIARHEMPCQPAEERIKNFDEVALGYTLEMAQAEATRCLQCKKPLCRQGCPVEIDIPAFIAEVAKGDLDEANRIIYKASSLPAVCGRVCPQEKQCEGKCILGKKGEPVAIGRLERFVADNAKHECPTGVIRLGRKVACIGSGPASITCAGYLSRLGVDVTMFEGLHEAGGVLIYGIPAFRLPKDVVARELDCLRSTGVDIRLNYVGGRTVTVQSLLDEGHEAVFIGVGAGLPYFLGVPGENCIGVFSANEYLTRVNLGRAHSFPNYDTPVAPGKHVTVFGAGNVAMVKTALEIGANTFAFFTRNPRGSKAKAEDPADCAKAVELLKEYGFGRILNTTSGIKLDPQQAGYSASKAALDKITIDLAHTVEGTDVMINLTDPGWCRTDLGGPHAPNAPESAIPGIVVGVFVDDKKSGRNLGAQNFAGMTLEEAVKKAETEFASLY